MLWTNNFRDKCLGTDHKIKSVICTLLWINIHFKCIHIVCEFTIYFNFVILHLSLWHFNECPSFILCNFIFYSKITLQPISYAGEMIVAKTFMAKLSRTTLWNAKRRHFLHFLWLLERYAQFHKAYPLRMWLLLLGLKGSQLWNIFEIHTSWCRKHISRTGNLTNDLFNK